MLKRGFKAWTEKEAAKIRLELQIEPVAPVSATDLAVHFEFKIMATKDLPNLESKHLNQLLHVDPQAWSAVSIFSNDKRLIIYNEKDSVGRISYSIAHEVAHVICGHQPKQAHSANSALMLDNYDKLDELEADTLAGTILLPRVALVHEIKLGNRKSEIASKFNVSESLTEMRLRLSGIYRQYSRIR